MQGSRGHVLGVAIAFVVGFLLLLGTWRAVSATSGLGYEPSTLRATATGPRTATVTLSGFPDSYACHGSNGGPHPDWVTFCPTTSLQVPAHSDITVIIKQYDTGTPLHNPFFQLVRGTVGETAQVDGRTVSGLNSAASDIGHTFTIQSAPDSPAYLFVNVPLGAPSSTAPNAVTINGHPYPKPVVTVFRFRTGAAGHYIWHCYIPCGTGLVGDQNNFGGPMATTGYMSGTFTVG